MIKYFNEKRQSNNYIRKVLSILQYLQKANRKAVNEASKARQKKQQNDVKRAREIQAEDEAIRVADANVATTTAALV